MKLNVEPINQYSRISCANVINGSIQNITFTTLLIAYLFHTCVRVCVCTYPHVFICMHISIRTQMNFAVFEHLFK